MGKIDNYVKAKSNQGGKSVTIYATNTYGWIRVYGCSCPMTATTGDMVRELTVFPREGEDAVLSFSTYMGGDRSLVYSGIFHVWNKGVSPTINFEVYWTPTADRMGQQYDDRIEVRVDDVVYYAPTRPRDGRTARKVDGNAICAFLAGTIDAETLAASADPLEGKAADAAMIAGMQRELEMLGIAAQGYVGVHSLLLNAAKTAIEKGTTDDLRSAVEAVEEFRATGITPDAKRVFGTPSETPVS